MKYNPEKHHRRSIRLRGWDYARSAAYFVTVCIQDRERPLTGRITCLFGNVVDGEMRLSEFGRIVARAWDDLPSHYPTVELDAFIVMPNHVHGIIVLTNNEENGTVGAGNVMAQMIGAGLSRPNGTTPALGSVVAYFKYQSTKQINVFQGTPGIRVWQRNYFERIIRDSRELEGVRWYIAKNPSRWDSDRDPRVL